MRSTAGNVTSKRWREYAVRLLTVTVTGEYIAPAGTRTTNCVGLAESTGAKTPPTLTRGLPFVSATRLLPSIANSVPIGPDVGWIRVITGATPGGGGSVITVSVAGALITPGPGLPEFDTTTVYTPALLNCTFGSTNLFVFDSGMFTPFR